MLLQFKNCLGAGMEITFKDLKNSYSTLRSKQRELQYGLQDFAQKLVAEYEGSLAVPDRRWFDAEDEGHLYVKVGLLTSSGEFKEVALPHIQLNDNYELRFVIATNLDDNPVTGGAYHGINIVMYMDYATLTVAVGSGDDSAVFRVHQTPGGFHEVCGAIKVLIERDMKQKTPRYYLSKQK